MEKSKHYLFLLAVGIAAAATSMAAMPETKNYSYDARGRLIKVDQSPTIGNDILTNYVIDKAGNREMVTVVGAPK